MAKTKKESSTTAKIKELTGVKPEKVTDEQLKIVQDLINDINRVFVFVFYNITDSMSTIDFLSNSIVHSVILIIFTYCNFSNQF